MEWTFEFRGPYDRLCLELDKKSGAFVSKDSLGVTMAPGLPQFKRVIPLMKSEAQSYDERGFDVIVSASGASEPLGGLGFIKLEITALPRA